MFCWLLIACSRLCICVSPIVLILKTMGHAPFNYYMHLNLTMHLLFVNCYVLGHDLLIVMQKCCSYGSVFHIKFSLCLT